MFQEDLSSASGNFDPDLYFTVYVCYITAPSRIVESSQYVPSIDIATNLAGVYTIDKSSTSTSLIITLSEYVMTDLAHCGQTEYQIVSSTHSVESQLDL